MVDCSGKVRQYVLEAQKKGVLFDVGHGGGSFHYQVSIPAFRQGLAPNTFGTDMHRQSINAGMKDMLNIMSKYLNMGMQLQDVIYRATWSSANAINKKELGHLSEGAVADIAILRVKNGDFGFLDAGGNRMDGKQKLECELTVRDGKVVYDLNGIAANGVICLTKK